MGFLERLAVLFKRGAVVLPEAGREPPLKRHALHGGPAWDRLRFDMAGLAAALEPALDGGHRNREDPRDLLPGHPAVDRREHPDPQVLRVGFHVRRLAGGSILMHTAVGPG